MFALRGALLAALSSSAQIGVECFQAQQQSAAQRQPLVTATATATATASTPPTPPALDGVSSVKLSRIVERMCGLKGDELSVQRQCAEPTASRLCRCCHASAHASGVGVGAALFSGECAVRWLLQSGVVDRPVSALLLCRSMLRERAVLPACAPSAPFYSSLGSLYAFGCEYSGYERASEADIERLCLHSTAHADVVAALCKHYNQKQERERRRLSDRQPPASAEPPLALSDGDSLSSSIPQVASHRAFVVGGGVFLGSELVRWLKRTKAARSTRDAVVWGNFLLQQQIIRACTAPQPHDARHSSDASHGTGSASQASGSFRYAAVWYELQPASEHLAHHRSQHPSPDAAAASARPALAADEPNTATFGQPASSASSLGPHSAAPGYVATPPPLSSVALELPIVDSATARTEHGSDSAEAEAESGAAERREGDSTAASLLPLSLLCDAALPHSHSRSHSRSSSVPALLAGWEFVQSFGDEAGSYDFADADDLVTAVEFHPSGEYLAIGDKAGRVSIVEEAALRTGAADDSDERAAEREANGAAMHSPLEFRFFTEVQSHVPEFDCLKSVDVSPRIVALEWWPLGSSHLTLLAANDRSVKVWRVESKQSQFDRQERQQLRASKRTSALQRSERQSARSLGDGSDAAERLTDSIPSLWSRAASLSDVSGDDFPPVSSRCCAVFRGGHAYSIHSVSSCADGATFLSADDLRVLLFDLEHSDTACSVLELPAAQPSAAAVDELLTVARFHPHHANLFLHGSSSGTTRIADMRLRLNCTRHHTLHTVTATAQPLSVSEHCCAVGAGGWVLCGVSGDGRSVQSFTAAHSSLPPLASSSSSSSSLLSVSSAALSTLLPVSAYLRSVTDSVLDARWCVSAVSSHTVFTRDFLFCRSWDLRRLSHPLTVAPVHPSLLSSLPALLESEALFDSFELCASPSGRHLVSGSYDNSFALVDAHSGSAALVQAKDDAREPLLRQVSTAEQLPHAVHRLATPQQRTTHSLHAAFARCYTPPVHAVSSEQQQLSGVAQQQKVLKVAWHPRLEAVAVAGLYKLYLYQNRQPAHCAHTGAS